MPDFLEQGFFAKVGAWHGKGTVTAERLTAEQAYQKSGQDYQVVSSPIFVNGLQVKNHFATVRADTGGVLGVVGNKYKIIQNKSMYDVLAPVIDSIGAVYETGGVLKEGAIIWALAKLEKSNFTIGNEDLVNMYMLLAMGHDGSMPLIATPTTIRVVCWNTLSMALSLSKQDGRAIVRIAHKSDAYQYIPVAHRLLGLTAKNGELASAFFSQIAARQVNSVVVNEFVAAMFPSKKEDEGKEAGVIVQRARMQIRDGFDSPINNIDSSIRHSGWSLYNAFTDYIDHNRPMRAGTNRQLYSWFGAGQNQRIEAVNWINKNVLNGTN